MVAFKFTLSEQSLFVEKDVNTIFLERLYRSDEKYYESLMAYFEHISSFDEPCKEERLKKAKDQMEYRKRNIINHMKLIRKLNIKFCMYIRRCNTIAGLKYLVHKDSSFFRNRNYYDCIIRKISNTMDSIVVQEAKRIMPCIGVMQPIKLSDSYNVLEVSPCDETITEEVLDFNLYMPKFECKMLDRHVIHSSCREFPELPFIEKVKVINIQLQGRLREKIFDLWKLRQRLTVRLQYYGEIVLNRLFKKIERKRVRCDTEEIEVAVPQMENSSAHGENPVTENSAGNVVLTEARVDTVVQTAPTIYNWSNYTSSDIVGNYSEMTSRWLKVKTFEWNVNHARDTDLLVLSLPLDVIKNDKWTSCQIPNTIPFKVHRYWKGDMVVKIQLNSNKFQIGQLQCVWYYQPELDDKFDLRKCVEISSQNDHVLISAGSSNEVTIRIPFKNHMPMISTKTRADIQSPLSLGKLFIRVLNPLSVVQTGPQKCNGSVFVKFENCEFTGQIDGNIDEVALPQMDTFAKAALGALNAVTAPNMDNPPVVRAPSYLVPTASHSWSFGTGATEPLHSLRLDAKGQTQHPDRLPDEHSIKNIVGKFGLIKTIEWDAEKPTGSLLWSCDASPILNTKSYKKLSQDNTYDLTRYCIPPVGVIASLFNYWRGGMDFRFDIIATQFHTGRVLVGYVPGATESTDVTLETVLAGPHMVFTLNESQQFTYSIPYVADRPFWSRRYMGDYQDDSIWAPSRLYVFVLNPLIPMEAVVQKIFINIYQRGSENFEVAVPVQPCVGLAYNPSVLYNSSMLVFAIEGYAPYYPGVYYKFLSSSALVMRYGTGGGAVSWFDSKYLLDTDKSGKVYFYEIQDVNSAPTYFDDTTQTYIAIKFAVLVWLDKPSQTAIMVPIKTEDNAKACAIAYQDGNQDGKACKPYVITDIHSSSNGWSNGNPGWIVKIARASEYVVVQGEREQTDNAVSTDGQFASTDGGFSLFGERFTDLKDYMRRYMVYSAFMFIPSDTTQPGQCSYILPILPQGLNLNLGTPSEIMQFSNRCRDGPIPLILSGFRYARGGVRVRVVLPTTVDCIIWVQHKPDRKIRQLIPIRCRDVNTAEALGNHGYATYIQDTGVNSIIEVEIPFYLNSAYMLLQRPKLTTTNEAFYFGLGELSIGFMFTKRDVNILKGFLCTVYYSVADDFQASTFQGFPPVVFLDEITNALKEEVEEERIFIEEQAVPQGLFDSIKKKITDEVQEGVSTVVADHVGEMSKVAVDKLEEIRQVIQDTAPTDIVNMSIFRTFITNICHILANCNLKSIGIGICAIMCELGILTLDISSMFITKCIEFLTQLSRRSGTELNIPDVAEEAAPQMRPLTSGEEAATGLITILWTGMCSLFAIKAKPPTDIGKLSDLLTKDIKGVVQSANGLFVFLRNIFSVIDSIKAYLYGKLCPRDNMLGVLSESYAEAKAWVEEVTYLDDPKIFDNEKFTQMYKLRVNAAFVRGMLLYQNTMEIQDQKITRVISKMFDRIRDVRERLLEFGDDCYVRKEPFVMWQVGTAGVGKSTFANHLIFKLLASRGIKPSVPPIYNHEASSDFWDSCNGNPAMMVDDMFSVKSGPTFERHLALIFSVVSPVVLCPPKAKLEDKGKPYNPEILMLNSNYDYLNFNGVDMDAVHRRRHVLFKTEANTKKKACCTHCQDNIPVQFASPDELKDFHHLQFRVANNVLKDSGWSAPMDYDDFMKYIIGKYAEVGGKNDVMYQQRIGQVLNLINVDDCDVDNFEEAYERVRDKQMHEYKKMVSNSVFGKLRECYLNKKDLLRNVCLRMNINFRIPVIPSFLKTEIPNSTVTLTNGEVVGDEALLSQKIWEMYESGTSQMNCSSSVFRFEEATKRYQMGRAQEYCQHLLDQVSNLCDSVGISCYHYDSKELAGAIALSEFYDSEGMTLGDLMMFIRQVFDYHYVKKCNFATFMRKLYNEPLNYCKFSQFEDTSVCSHLSYDPADCEYSDDCIRKDGKNVEVVCDSTFCLWESIVFRYFWYDRYSFFHKSVVLKNLYPTKKNMKSIPTVFRFYDVIDMPDDTMWRKAILAAKAAAAGAVLGSMGALSAFLRVWNVMWTWFKKFLPIIVAITGAAAMLTASVVQYKTLKAEIFEQNMAWSKHQSNAYGINQNIKLNDKVPTAVPHGDMPQFDIAVSRILSNTFEITAVFDGRQISVAGLVLRDRQVILLRHYMEEFAILPPHTQFYGNFNLRKDFLQKGVRGIEFDLRSCDTIYYDKIDNVGAYASNYLILTLPVKFPQCKDLTQFIATAKQHELCTGDGVLVKNDGMICENINFVREKSRPLNITPLSNSSHVVLQDLYSYKLQKRGMCGSILLARNLERPIVGMHVAGVEIGNVRGIAELLTYETFNEVPVGERNYESSVLPTLDDAQFRKIDIESNIYPYGCVEPQYYVHQSGDTQIVPSCIAGVFPIQTEPNPLKTNDPRLPPNSGPLKCGIAHMGKMPRDFPREALEDAQFDLRKVILQNVRPVRQTVGVVSLEDAICGNSKISGFEPLEWSTSPGFPLRFHKDKSKCVGKKWLFELEVNEDGYKLRGIHKKLKEILILDQSLRERGIKPFTVFIDCLKDTCLPKEKCCIPGKTRIFSISPVQFTIQFKQYFLDFMAAYQKARFSAEHAIGIDVNSCEWTDLVGLLQSKGDKIICGDYKNYGPGLMLKAAECAFEIILDWYKFHGNESDNAVRRVMIYEIVGAYHLCQNFVYSTPCGIPSGSPITTPLNSLVGSLYVRIVWKMCTNLNYSQMGDYCTVVTYGDDVCINVSDEVCELFNTETMSECFGKFNIVFTDADKSGNLVKWRSIDTAQFLKCRFKRHPNRYDIWLAALEKISVEGCANWINRKNNIMEATVQNAEQCLMLAHGHGPDYYNEVLEKLQRALYNVGLTFRYDSWYELDMKRYGTVRVHTDRYKKTKILVDRPACIAEEWT